MMSPGAMWMVMATWTWLREILGALPFIVMIVVCYNRLPPWSVTDTHHASSIAWGDVDNDGDLDLAVADQSTIDPNKIYKNALADLTLVNVPVMVITPTGKTDKANFYARTEVLTQNNLPITYSLTHTSGYQVRQVEAFYSFQRRRAMVACRTYQDHHHKFSHYGHRHRLYVYLGRGATAVSLDRVITWCCVWWLIPTMLPRLIKWPVLTTMPGMPPAAIPSGCGERKCGS